PNVILSQSCNLKRLLLRRIPILAWLPLYSWSKLLQDTLAGLTVGLTAIPQGIAYAIVAGLPAQYGLYSSFMGCFVYLVFGSCKDVTVGPTAIMALMVQKYVNSMGEDIAVLVCFLSGTVITFMGILHLGFLVDFISMPVICGFSNAAAIIIATSQLSTLLGIKGRSDSFIDAISHVVKHINETQLWDTVLGVCSMMLLILFKKLPGKKQGTPFEKFMWLISLARNAIVVMVGILIAYELYSHDLKPFQITGNITEGLPPFSLPPFTIINGNHTYTFTEIVGELSSSILSIPFIAILESIAIAKAFAKGKTLDANQEMLAVGLCNICGSFVRSMPVTGSFTRTAINNSSGVKTPFGGIITGSLVLLACHLLTSTIKYIPKATLAAVIMIAMFYMFETHVFVLLWRTKKIDLVPLIVTLLCCLAISLEYGMIIGIAVNLILLLYFAARPGLLIEERIVDGLTVLFVSPKQSLSFPAAEYLRERVMSWCDKRPTSLPVIIEGRHVLRIDTTVAKNLALLLSDLITRNQKIIFWNWCEDARQTLISYDSSFETYCKLSGSIAQIFAGKFSRKRPDGVSKFSALYQTRRDAHEFANLRTPALLRRAHPVVFRWLMDCGVSENFRILDLTRRDVRRKHIHQKINL
ncbi:S2611 protein, partial [Acromyrmex insinuator]